MSMVRPHRAAFSASVCIFVLTGLAVRPAFAQTAATPGSLRTYSTIYSIGFEWDLAGDTDHDASAGVEYRASGLSSWLPALPLVRMDYNGANMLAGSVLYLNPGTAYEVRVTFTDPDGVSETRTVTVATQPLPVMPAAARTFHVIPGSGGGSGSAGDPFRGVAAAQLAAQPGDLFLLHAGAYGGRIRFDRPGAAGNHIVWKGAGDGEVLMNGIDIAASHVWLEGLTVRNMAYATFSIDAPESVVIRRCGFFNNHYSVYLQRGGRNWYIADNTIVGDTPYQTESFDGEGIELNTTEGHTVAHNSITNVSDGISYPLRNVDMFGNDIFDTADDGIEGDYGYANVRMWGNRIHNAVHNGISFQPQYGGPWYIIRNQIVGNEEAPLKFRTTDRFVLLHNTFVEWTKMNCCNEQHLFGAIARNNLWISSQGGQMWSFGAYTRDWRTDLDYDGFDWGLAPSPFSYGSVAYPDVPSFASASGLQANGLRVDKATCFDSFDVPGPPPVPIPPQTLTLQAGCAAVDAGAVLPNINADAFTGTAPDLGAFERGQPVASYGPRAGPTARFTAWPATIAAGGVTTLQWTTTDATTVTIDPPLGSPALSAVVEVRPAATTTYTLTATGAEGVATATVTVTVEGQVTPPAPPAGLTAEPISSTRVRLAWIDNSANETGFRVERSLDGVSFVELASTAANVASYLDEALAPASTYWYRVAAYNEAGSSEYSAIVTATTPPLPALPDPPANLVAAAVSSGEIRLTWEDRSTTEQGFEIEQSIDGVSFARVASVAAGVTSYTAGGLSASSAYWYRLRAFNEAGTSAYSNVAMATTPQAPIGAPTGLTATTVSRNRIDLAWTDNAAAESGYRIERALNGGTFSQIAATGPNVTAWSDTTVRQNKTYSYRLRAYDATANSAYSNVASATTPRK